ncbi:MAG: hypothetical protein WCW56_02215 [Candidatus Paceibacterota bacterium]
MSQRNKAAEKITCKQCRLKHWDQLTKDKAYCTSCKTITPHRYGWDKKAG